MLPPLILCIFLHFASSVSALDFIYNSFTANPTSANFTLTDDARIQPPVIRLTSETNPLSLGRVFYPTKVPFKTSNSSNVTTSFSTQFVFSILPDIASSPGFGIAFVLCNTTAPPDAVVGQYFGLFTNGPKQSAYPLLAVEFDTGRNTELNDPVEDHVGIDLDSVISVTSEPAGYYNATGDPNNFTFVNVPMRTGQNIHVWLEFNGPQNEINVTIAPAGVPRPEKTLLSYRDPAIANYFGPEMVVGFSASITRWIEAQRLLAWSFSDVGIARDINTTGLPVFLPMDSGSSSLSHGAVAGIVVGCVVAAAIAGFLVYWFWWKRMKELEEDDEIEDWEMEYWPHRYSYEELSEATKGFSDEELLGSGGFGKVYKGTLTNNIEVAVKCVNHDSKQGLREFMAEISSMGRLQHKNLVQMRGWCRKRNALLLVYDYMPNGSLNKWIFDKPMKLMNWGGRKRVLADVAEGLNYLHHGWDQVVVHRDIKSSNVLLDSEMRGRLGDFGLAKLYSHGEVPNTTRVVGTLGYLAPEVATLATPTAASDVYSFGVVVLEVACGRRPIEIKVETEDEEVLIDWVRQKYSVGRLSELADKRIKGEYEVEEMEAVLKLGLSCCHPDPLRRPTMKEVIAVLIGENLVMTPKDLLSEIVHVSSKTDRAEGGEREANSLVSHPLDQV
ncbi:L-type lectin-domain containing receptor kinase S.1 [Dorcoceras hygrometricum]|uniref:non-specific serine/threonine protein kinase n=1 Tax=Dorcoceras hygrometricum TaxID=472368 RepID=A0A2Z7D1T6_9LAMI|nr:L-type lectin-domain containing receptor kinase S.1 [Dorcoceras hygrometricum]